jgi:chemotaxis-related protein WspD
MTDEPREQPGNHSEVEAFFDRPPPPDYLDEWARRLAQPPEQGESDLQSLVVFRLRGEWLALPSAAVAEVTDPQPIHAIPHRTNRVLSGLVNIRGQLRLAVSLHGLFDVEDDESAGTAPNPRFLVLQDGPDQWVCAAEEVVGIQRLTRERLRAVPSTFPRAVNHTRAVFDWDGRTVGLLDAGVLFASLRSHCR